MNKSLRISLLFLFQICSANETWKPRVTIITSVYKGDKFIKGFLEDIVQQTIFNDCELIIINANSPEKEDDIIKRYADKYRTYA